MPVKVLTSRVVNKHATEAQWNLSSLVPMQGELIIYDIDSNYTYERFKIGDGIHSVNELPFATEILEDAILDSVADWNQNDESALNYVKNRTHYDSRTDGEVNITYNGGLTDYEIKQLSDTEHLVKVSNLAATEDQLIGAAIVFLGANSMEHYAVGASNLTHDNGNIYVHDCVLIVPEDTAEFSKGTWFKRVEDPVAGATYPMTFAYTGTVGELKKLDPKYLPDVVEDRFEQLRNRLAGKLDAPGSVKLGDYLRVQSIGADGTVVLEGAEGTGGGSGENVGKCPERLYVEDYKTDKNTWNDAFDALFAECLASRRVACTGGTYYALTAPLYIGNIDVDFENCELSNNVPESESNPACVVLTGAEKRVQKFGTVTGRQSVGILVNTATGLYKFNRLHAKLIQGWSGALWLSTTKYTCCFNEFHVPLLKSADVALKTWSESRKTKWVNECHFYLASIEMYRSTYPAKLIEMTNATRCNIYNVDLECGDWQTPDPNRTVEVELTDCCDVAFYNPRTKEGYNAVQFRFIGECTDNFIDAEYSKYRTIDSSQMVMSDFHYNVWRGRTVTGNTGSVTNAKNLRIYKNMIVPEMLCPMVAEVTADKTISAGMMGTLNKLVATGKYTMGGIPTLLKWSAGNITIDKRFIALLPTVIQIMRVSDTVGNILDMDGNIILSGTELELNKRCDIRVDSATYVTTEAIGETKEYACFYDISLAIGDFVEEAAKEWTGEETVTHTFVDGFVRTSGTINAISTNYKYTGLVKYKGGSVDFRAISASTGVSCAIVAFFDNEKKFLGSLETAVGGHDTFYAQYNTGEYTALNGSNIGADVMGGTITAEQIAEWYPAATYIAVSCPTVVSATISKIYNSIDNPCMATQTY